MPGKISQIFFPMFFKAPPTPFPRLVSPFLRLFTITPITKPTADTTANTVKPYFLKMALTRSLRLIRSSICSFSASSLEISFSKLADAAGVSENEAKEWLKKQALWQIYLPSPRYIPRPHWTVEKPNEIHQADLLFLPHDTVRRKTFKYALVVVDVASRYKDAEPLTSKESSEVAKSFEKIYSRKLKWPVRIIIDPGKEFMGHVTSLMKRHNVIIQRSEAGNHRAQAFVERANRTLSERLFSFQYGKEMSSDDNERSREWVERLPAVLKSMNNEVTRLTGKEPQEVLKSKQISINAAKKKYNRPVGFDEVRLSPFAKVRYLFAPGEYEGGERRRATDPVWSLVIFELSHSKVSPDQPVMYYLSGGPKRSFVREELQVVPEDSEAPPKKVK